MKWQSFPMSIAKTFSLALSTFTMVMGPLAQGAEAAKKSPAPVKVAIDYSQYKWDLDKNSVQEYMKRSGLGQNKKTTVGEFYSKMRPYYPASMHKNMDLWAQLNRNEIMPDVEVSTYKDVEGKEQIRLQLTLNKKTATISYSPGSNDKYIKFNNSYLTKADVLFPEQLIRKLAQNDKMVKADIKGAKPVNRLDRPLKLSYEEFSRLTPRQRANYMIRVRELVQSAQQVNKKFDRKTASNDMDSKYEYVMQLLTGFEAQAEGRTVRGAKEGDSCVVAGWVSSYGQNYSCGGKDSGRKNLNDQIKKYGYEKTCTGGKIPCMPLLYHSADGSNICITNPSSQLSSATYGECPGKAPLKSAKDHEDLVKGYLKTVGIEDSNLKVEEGEDGRMKASKANLSKEEYDKINSYMEEVNDYVQKAINTCRVAPLADVKKVREEQEKACDAIAQRFINIDFYDGVVAIPPPPAPQPPVAENCELTPGSISVERNGKMVCECPAGRNPSSIDDPERGQIASCNDMVVTTQLTQKKEECNDDQKYDKDKPEGQRCVASCGVMCWVGKNKGLVLGIGAAVIIGGILISRNHDTKTPPVPPCLTPAFATTALCVPVVPTPPPVQPPPGITPTPTPPITVVTPTPTPPIIVPTPVPTVEDTSNPNNSNAGGVRKQKGTR